MNVKNERNQTFRIMVIGGGISGLAAAHRLTEIAPQAEVRLIESSERLGGVLQTTSVDGYLLEHSADNFIVTDELPDAGKLCERLGLASELLDTNRAHRRALILRGRTFYPVPEGLQLMTTPNVWPIIRSGLLSWKGKLRLAAEPWIRQRAEPEDESLAQFATRRLGREAYERLVQPLVAGIFTADPEKLSMQAALPQFVDMERRYGSLGRAARLRAVEHPEEGQASGARYAMFRAPKLGMQQLVQALEDKLRRAGVQIDLNRRVATIQRVSQQWQVVFGNGDETFTDAVIVATPVAAAAALFADVAPKLSQQLRGIRLASSSVACLAFRQEQIARPLDAFGAVIPHAEGRPVLAFSFSSVKFPGRVPHDDEVLIRVFVGGALQPELADLDDQRLRCCAMSELRELWGVTGEPLLYRVFRWKDTMPQFLLGHRERIALIEQMAGELPTLELTGNYFAGVGIPQCIRRGELVADRVARVAARRSAGI